MWILRHFILASLCPRQADKRVMVEETAMLRASLVSVAGALTEALHKGDSDATRSVLKAFTLLDGSAL